MNQDVERIFYLNELLNRMGMDSISAGHTVAFAMECFERGIITLADTGGVALDWGSAEAVTFLIEKMCTREGIGNLLADGVKQAAQALGNEAQAFAVHAGGQEPGMHDSRNDPGFALHYSVEPAPGRHTNGAGLYYEMFQLWKVARGLPIIPPMYLKSSKYKQSPRHAEIGAINSKFMNVINGAGVCLFGAFLGAKRIRIFDWLNAATGWSLGPGDYLEIGARVQTVKQAFNVRHGIEPKSNRISDRALGIPAQERGANRGRTVDVDTMMADYWEQFGWDRSTGKPSPDMAADAAGNGNP
jgi:aldehyde:ferredoxin oxidoreductase